MKKKWNIVTHQQNNQHLVREFHKIAIKSCVFCQNNNWWVNNSNYDWKGKERLLFINWIYTRLTGKLHKVNVIPIVENQCFNSTNQNCLHLKIRAFSRFVYSKTIMWENIRDNFINKSYKF